MTEYTITVNVDLPNDEGDVEAKTISETFDDKEKVKEFLQQMNSYRVRGLEPLIYIEDDTGNECQPHDFGLPKPSMFKSKLAKYINDVLEAEGDRTMLTKLLEEVAAQRTDAWDIQQAMDEVYGEWIPDVGTMHDAVLDIEGEESRITVVTDDSGEGVSKMKDAIEATSDDEVIEIPEEIQDDFMKAINSRKARS